MRAGRQLRYSSSLVSIFWPLPAPIVAVPVYAEVPQGQTGSSKQECMCKPGFGSPTGEGTCRLCPTATYSFGGSMEDCKPCPFGTTSMPGAKHIKDCEPIPQECPVGQVALLGAVAASQCVCLPGHGGRCIMSSLAGHTVCATSVCILGVSILSRLTLTL